VRRSVPDHGGGLRVRNPGERCSTSGACADERGGCANV